MGRDQTLLEGHCQPLLQDRRLPNARPILCGANHPVHGAIDDELLEVKEIFQGRDACDQGERIIHVEALYEIPDRVATATPLPFTTAESGAKPAYVTARRKARAFLGGVARTSA